MVCNASAVQRDERSAAQESQTKLRPNESITLTLKPLPVDRTPALRVAGLCAVALGARGLGSVTPSRRYRSRCEANWS